LNADPGNYTIIPAGEVSFVKTNLLSYYYYHAKLVVCLTFTCESNNRFLSELNLYRVVPEIAAFDGILDIQNPTDVANPDRVKVIFNSPITTNGVLTGLEVYCHSTVDDMDSILVPVGSTIPPGTKDGCDGLGRMTPNPANLAGYSSYNNLIVNGIQYIGSSAATSYCLSIIPVIEGDNYTRREFENSVIRCVRPEVQLPSVEEFPGAIQACDVTSDTMRVRWLPPTGGLYSNFKVFWKEVDGSPFKFSEAILGLDARYVNNEEAIAGNTLVLDLNQTEYTITGLSSGKRYQYGVLAYIETAPGEFSYSEFNQAPRECNTPQPKATFQEWVHISAVGPKEIGLASPGSSERFALETFDDLGNPIEVEVDSSGNPTDLFEAQFGFRRGNTSFSGVYGTPDNDPSSPERHMYSNTGIVQLIWKDVRIDGQTIYNLSTFIDADEVAAFKPSRQTGYRVLRSADGMKNWVDLTSAEYPFQSPTNAGLVHPQTLFERVRSNAASESFDGIVFTDYSVQSFDYRSLPRDDYDRVDRARVYYYKIVPVLNGVPLEYNNENQNIIKVTLPPKNQALIHRLIANRQTCRELGRAHSGNVHNHYVCDYHGIGSRSLAPPWRSDTVVYDLGGDVLMDRFELGCDFSRGDISNSRSHFNSSSPQDDSLDFTGFNNDGTPFKGCLYSNSGVALGDINNFTPRSPAARSSDDTPDSSIAYTSYKQMIRGDCFGRDRMSLYLRQDTTCSNPLITQQRIYGFPGARDSIPEYYTCENPQNTLNALFDLFSTDSREGAIRKIVAQSEFAGVHHNTSMLELASSGNIGIPHFRSANSLPVNQSALTLAENDYNASSCFVNLPVMDPLDGARLVPRWLPANRLFNVRYHDLDGTHVSTMNLLGMSLDEILNDGRLYNDGTVVAGSASRASAPPVAYINARYSDQPNRLTAQTPLARIVSSNAAKLPPIHGLRQEDANVMCSTYQVEVGQVDSSGSYLQLAPPKAKNLARRKEFIAAAAWNSDYSNAQIVDIERGEMQTLPFDDDVAGTVTVNNSCNTPLREVATYNSSVAAAGTLIDPRAFDTRVRPSYFTGSSFYDHQSFNSMLCQSRYGIQDMVGNIGEWGTEVFRCDTAQESLFLGEKNQPLLSIPLTDSAIVDIDIVPWVLGNLDSGRCSPVSRGDDRPREMDATFTARSFELGGAFAPVFDGLGNLNTNLVLEPQLDQDAVNQLRNGDGFFLDFGSTGIAPPIDSHDTISLLASTRGNYRDGDARRGLSFNPVIGLPLECNGGSCLETQDNLSFITTGLRTRIGTPEGDYEIPNFPVGNSNIISDGLAEWGQTETYQTMTALSREYTYIETIHPGETPDRTFRTRNTNDPDFHQARIIAYQVPRNARMGFSNGGSRLNSNSGRYTTRYTHNAVPNPSLDDSGARCSVMINMD
jgi:hypothetical protein